MIKNKKQRALTAYEDTNMHGGAHTTNIEKARKAANEKRDLIIHSKHYDGQLYNCGKYRVCNLELLNDGSVEGITEDGELWKSTNQLCDYAITGRI